MICPNCGTENRDCANFCHNCRHPLGRPCPNCGTDNPEDFHFCDHCGHDLQHAPDAHPELAPLGPAPRATISDPPADKAPARLAAAAGETHPKLQQLIPQQFAQKLAAARAIHAMEGERRVVTMLFCDVKGSTYASTQLDPENWGEVMNGLFEHMIAPVYHYEGTVARLMGDAILAFFGAPIAHEDDPQRAVLAGLEIIERIATYRKEIERKWGVDVDVRIGINTGLVLVGQVGSDLQMEYTALGEAINLAARMEQTAKAGSVQITEHTHKFLSHAFAFEDLGKIEVKGMQEAVQAYRVLGREVTSTFRRRGIEGMRAPLIGRRREWGMLSTAAESASRGFGQIVFVGGEAGLGKSRLIAELAQSLAGTVQWYETTSLSFEVSHPYGLFQRLLRRLCGATPQDKPDDLRSKIEEIVQELSAEEQPLCQKAFESIFNLAGKDGEPPLAGESFRDKLFSAFEHMLLEKTAQGTVVLICDDLHWTDKASVSLLEHLFGIVPENPLLLVCASRPEPDSPGWALRTLAERRYGHQFTEIALQPLTTRESNKLVDSLLDINDMPEALRGRILEHAEGNPFFVEEMVRELIESGAIWRVEEGSAWKASTEGDEIEIPDNLQALLTARIDRLDDDTRRVLQLAALIGRSFYYRVLEMIVNVAAREGGQLDLDKELEALQRADFIHKAAHQPELEYIFRHVLTQEAAYQTILLRQRRQYHRLVGEATEMLFRNQLEEHAARLSYHFSEAQDGEKALEYSRLAGDTALRLYASQEAAQHYSRALELAAGLREAGKSEIAQAALPQLYTGLGRAYELGSYFKEALAAYEAMEADGLALDDRSLRLDAVVLQGALRSIISEQFDPAESIRLSKLGLDLAGELDDKAAEARLHWNLLQVYRFVERASEAMHHGEQSLALSRELDMEEQIAYVSNDMIYTYVMNGLVDKAIDIAHVAEAYWRKLENLPMLVDSLSGASFLYSASGKIDEGINYSQQAFELASSINNTWGQAHSTYQIGIALWARGEIDAAIDRMRIAYRKGDESGFVVAQIWARGTLALLYSNLGDLGRARRMARESSARAETFLPSGYSAFVQAILARVALLEGSPEKAEGLLMPYDYNPEATLAKLAAPFVEYVHATILFARGDYRGVTEKTERMIRFFQDTGLDLYLPGAFYLRARALVRIEQPDEARYVFETGIEWANRMEARWWLWLLQKDLAPLMDDPEARDTMKASSEAHFDFILEHIQDDALRAGFLTSLA